MITYSKYVHSRDIFYVKIDEIVLWKLHILNEWMNNSIQIECNHFPIVYRFKINWCNAILLWVNVFDCCVYLVWYVYYYRITPKASTGSISKYAYASWAVPRQSVHHLICMWKTCNLRVQLNKMQLMIQLVLILITVSECLSVTHTPAIVCANFYVYQDKMTETFTHLKHGWFWNEKVISRTRLHNHHVYNMIVGFLWKIFYTMRCYVTIYLFYKYYVWVSTKLDEKLLAIIIIIHQI